MVTILLLHCNFCCKGNTLVLVNLACIETAIYKQNVGYSNVDKTLIIKHVDRINLNQPLILANCSILHAFYPFC